MYAISKIGFFLFTIRKNLMTHDQLIKPAQ